MEHQHIEYMTISLSNYKTGSLLTCINETKLIESIRLIDYFLLLT